MLNGNKMLKIGRSLNIFRVIMAMILMQQFCSRNECLHFLVESSVTRPLDLLDVVDKF